MGQLRYPVDSAIHLFNNWSQIDKYWVNQFCYELDRDLSNSNTTVVHCIYHLNNWGLLHSSSMAIVTVY